jgi:hypothetical protein
LLKRLPANILTISLHVPELKVGWGRASMQEIDMYAQAAMMKKSTLMDFVSLDSIAKVLLSPAEY